MKNANDHVGNRTRETFWLVAQCLDQLRHRMALLQSANMEYRNSQILKQEGIF
jgi:hypothetical protein